MMNSIKRIALLAEARRGHVNPFDAVGHEPIVVQDVSGVRHLCKSASEIDAHCLPNSQTSEVWDWVVASAPQPVQDAWFGLDPVR